MEVLVQVPLPETMGTGRLHGFPIRSSGGACRRRNGITKGKKSLRLDGEGEHVCVTSASTFVGFAVVQRLLERGYSVRAIVDNQEDEMRMRRKMGNNCFIEVARAEMKQVNSLTEAFNECSVVFHTSSFVDPAGLSGYTKAMVGIEIKVCENVIEACAQASSVRTCIVTSSLLACVWRDHSTASSDVVDHSNWSNETICAEKKLWYALGKLRAEKATWLKASLNGVKLATICCGLVTGPEFAQENSTATLAYLKDCREMYETGLLATIDVNKLAENHVKVLAWMSHASSGRFVCFDRVIGTENELDELTRVCGLPKISLSADNNIRSVPNRYTLSKRKFVDLISDEVRCMWEV